MRGRRSRRPRPFSPDRNVPVPPIASGPLTSSAVTRSRLLSLAITLAAAGLPPASLHAQQAPARSWFVQAGAAEHANAINVGLTRDWRWQKQYSLGRVTGYWEGTLGRWFVQGRRDSTQVGLTPVLRLYPDAWRPGWFVEGGIGVNAISPRYDNGRKRFSTTFQFGDHAAVGKRFGAGQRQEWSLRLQHYSNARIEQPNPGENFLQLRYSRVW